MGEQYRHYKGNVYEVIGHATHTETQERLVLYKRADLSGPSTWARPYDMFHGLTEDGEQRFTKVVSFEDLELGDTFMYECGLFMKVQENSGPEAINAVCLDEEDLGGTLWIATYKTVELTNVGIVRTEDD